MTTEPTAIGTVVRDAFGQLWVRCESGRMGSAVWLEDVEDAWVTCWSDICAPVIVHEGYVPPTPEPLYHGARVVSEAGLRLVRTYDGDAPDGHPWASPRGGSYAWSELSRPVTVISDGSDW